MKLEIKRSAKELAKDILFGRRFVYSCSVRLLASEEEIKLWEKYDHMKSKLINVSGGEFRAESFMGTMLNIALNTESDATTKARQQEFMRVITTGKSDINISFYGLLKGYTWEAPQVYKIFGEIPFVIAKQLGILHSELNAREKWDGKDEVLDITEW